jgi:hypothetical protein
MDSKALSKPFEPFFNAPKKSLAAISGLLTPSNAEAKENCEKNEIIKIKCFIQYKWICLLLLFLFPQIGHSWEFDLKNFKRIDGQFDVEQAQKTITRYKRPKNTKKKKQAIIEEYKETSEVAKVISQASIVVQQRLNVDRERADRIATLVIFASKQYDIDPRHMLAIIKVESDFNQSAHNTFSCKYKREKDKTKCGDHSVAQINYHVWKDAFLKHGKIPLDYNKLKTDDSYAVFRMAEILSILKNSYGKEKD